MSKTPERSLIVSHVWKMGAPGSLNLKAFPVVAVVPQSEEMLPVVTGVDKPI
jgi:hypothetical protein